MLGALGSATICGYAGEHSNRTAKAVSERAMAASANGDLVEPDAASPAAAPPWAPAVSAATMRWPRAALKMMR
ncbi:hypothetical protein D9M68_889010 [compost metagenome]